MLHLDGLPCALGNQAFHSRTAGEAIISKQLARPLSGGTFYFRSQSHIEAIRKPCFDGLIFEFPDAINKTVLLLECHCLDQ